MHIEIINSCWTTNDANYMVCSCNNALVPIMLQEELLSASSAGPKGESVGHCRWSLWRVTVTRL